MPSENADPRVPTPIERVVFVCEHGAAKSILAGTYFNLLAERHGLSARAIARGTEPGAEVSERVRADASETGVQLCTSTPTPLSDADATAADMVITFDVSAPNVESDTARRSWDGLPLLSQDFVGGKAAILMQVEALVAELKNRTKSTAAAARDEIDNS